MVSLLLTTLYSIWESSHIQSQKHFSLFIRQPIGKMDWQFSVDSTELTKLSNLLEAGLNLVQFHPNIFIFILLVTFSTYFSIFYNKVEDVSNSDTASLEISSSLSPELKPSKLCASPMTCASSSDCMSLSSLSCFSVFDHLIDNGNFDRYFKVHSSSIQNQSERSMIAEHKLDGQRYLIKVKDFDSNNDKIETLLLSEVKKHKTIKCRGIARYVTCWVEESFGVLSLYVQMEKNEGTCLEKFVKDGIDAQLAVKIIKKVAKVVKFMHGQGTALGGIDMGNIFVNQFGKVVVGQLLFSGSFEDDLIMLKKIGFDLLAHVHEGEVELVKKMVSEDRFVGKLNIYH